MISVFLRHHLTRAMRGEITNTIAHCHVRGLHSIMLHDEPGNRVRMFFADEANKMLVSGAPALAAHGHHCDVTLIPVFGPVMHVLCGRPTHCEDGDHHECTYSSGVTGASELVPTGRLFYFKDSKTAHLREPIQLKASTLHTVHVPPGNVAAWLVIEGHEDPAYDSRCYSLDPTLHRPEGLYRPLTDVTSVIDRVLRVIS